jgi:oxygen-independent coproporphyrinogen-3 oxidase
MSLSLYIHFPFCSNICSYCDFYKRKFSLEFQQSYFDTLGRELDLAASELEEHHKKIETIYIGGGTPSLANPDHLEMFLNRCREYFDIEPGIEFTLEINPESVDDILLARYKELGVTRPVLGFQSFFADQLAVLRRRHNVDHSYKAVYLLRALGYANFGVDMIFGLPGQTSARLGDDLMQIIDLAPPHISYYQLTVEKGTPLATQVENGKVALPDSDLCAAMYRGINEELKRHNYIRYEVSSFAKPGYECRHNMRYWVGDDYLGLGPSAHSFINNQRFANVADLDEYIKQINQGIRPIVLDNRSREEQMYEAIMLGLRTARGIVRENFRQRFDIDIEQAVNAEAFYVFTERGYIDRRDDAVCLTDSGLPLADEIIRRLV